MTKDKSINEEMLEIVKALSDKVEALERTIYAKDSLLMKAGLVVTNSPTPTVDNSMSGVTTDVSTMDWSDIHKMVERAGGN